MWDCASAPVVSRARALPVAVGRLHMRMWAKCSPVGQVLNYLNPHVQLLVFATQAC